MKKLNSSEPITLDDRLNATDSLEKRLIVGVMTLVFSGYFIGADLIQKDLSAKSQSRHVRHTAKRTNRRNNQYAYQ